MRLKKKEDRNWSEVLTSFVHRECINGEDDQEHAHHHYEEDNKAKVDPEDGQVLKSATNTTKDWQPKTNVGYCICVCVGGGGTKCYIYD